jgi:hypothetical protein
MHSYEFDMNGLIYTDPESYRRADDESSRSDDSEYKFERTQFVARELLGGKVKKNKKTTRCTRSTSTTGQAARSAKACRSEAEIPPKAGSEQGQDEPSPLTSFGAW